MKRNDIDRQLLDLAERQASVISLSQVRACGGDRHVADRRVRAGLWERLAVGVYYVRGAPLTWHSRLWAALLEAPGSVVGLRSAGRLQGLWAYRRFDAVQVTRAEANDHDLALGTLHRSSWLPAHHLVRIDGIPCTSLARTLFDLAGAVPRHLRSERGRVIHRERLRRVYNDAIHARGLKLERSAAVLAELGKRGRAGTVMTRELLASFGPDYVPTESELEDLFVSVLVAYGVEVPQRQRRLGTETELIGRVDFIYMLAKLVIEVDGSWHETPLQTDADHWRDIELQLQGFQVFRFTWRQLVEHPDRVAAVIRRALAAAAAAA